MFCRRLCSFVGVMCGYFLVCGLLGQDALAGAASLKDAADESGHLSGYTAPKTSIYAALLFWGFAAICVFGSLFVITRKNLIVAVMGMVGTFFAIACTYVMLYAHFMAVIQVLVYAGAIMVLFVFVIMIMNRPEEEPLSNTSMVGKVLGVAALVYLGVKFACIVWQVDVPFTTDTLGPHTLTPGALVDGSDWGSTAAMGSVLFSDFLFPFEMVSIVLLTAVVGAVAVARPYANTAASTAATSVGGESV